MMTSDDFTYAYESSAPQLLRSLTRIFKDPEEARDVLHDAMLQAWRDRHRFESGRGSGGAWLNVITRTRALDRLRRLATQRSARLAPPVATTGDAERRVAALELRRAIERLPHGQRDLLSRQLEDRSQSEIARETGIPLGTVKARMRSAMGTLRDAMGG